MAKRGKLIATFFLLALIVGITSAQASTIDLTATLSSLLVTANEDTMPSLGYGVSGPLSGHLNDNAPISGGQVQDSASSTALLSINYQFTSYGEYSNPGSLNIHAVVDYTAKITQGEANPFQSAAWTAYLSWGDASSNTSSLFQKNLNPVDLTGDTYSGSTPIDFTIPFIAIGETGKGGMHTITVSLERTLTLHLEQSGFSAASAVPLPGTFYLLGSGLVALVGRRLWLGSMKS